MKTNKWLEVNSDTNNMYIDIIDLGPVFMIRTYRWCPETDTMQDLQTRELDHQIGCALYMTAKNNLEEFLCSEIEINKLKECVEFYAIRINEECIKHDEYDFYYTTQETGEKARQTLEEIK